MVVWDLDDTFWKGTLSEGGIEDYVQAHHDLVIELSRRGIMSSICSKNDPETALDVLRQRGIADYFIFPSISWDVKSPRLAALIDTVQLRPETVMFIDDNPMNRHEAAAMIPGLQIEDERFIPHMLADPRFRGKDDSNHTRLAQYKLLETRKRDQSAAVGGNEAFLRGCDIRVFIDYDFDNAANLDRAIELIQRTNQLNFTKQRLPEDIEQARATLRAEIELFYRQAGLVRVADRYGDYGYVGFFMSETDVFKPIAADTDRADFRRLLHFCFSCRTLGMQVERWVYDYLGRPEMTVVGEVVTDLSDPVEVDWIRLTPSIAEAAAPVEPLAPEIRLYGGCEANALSVYLTPYADEVRTLGNFSASHVFYRLNSSALAISAFDRASEAFAAEAKILGAPPALLSGDYFADAPRGTAFILNTALDVQGRPHYRHRAHGWEFVFEMTGCESLDLTVATDADVQAGIDKLLYVDAEGLAHIAAVARHIRENYETTSSITDAERVSSLRAVIERVGPESKLIILLDHHRLRKADGTVRDDPLTRHYNDLVRSVAAEHPFVETAAFSDAVRSDEEIRGGSHFDRLVYLRMAELIVEALRRTPGRPTRAEAPSRSAVPA